jgi:Tfp pilus assembly PilM family ATPase
MPRIGPRLAGGVRDWASRSRAWLREPEAPTLGIEVRATSVGALRLTRGRTLAAAASLRLPEGVVQPAMTRENLLDKAAFTGAVRQVIERVGGLTEKRVAIALPDSVARTVVLNEPQLAIARGAALADLVRFKLRDKVPFDIRQALVVSEPMAGANGSASTTVVALAVLRSVVEEYEGVLASLGLSAGLVEISGLALLRAGAATVATGDWMTLNWDEDHFTLFLTRQGVPLLARTVLGRIGAEAIGRELSSTILYHSERLGGQPLSGVRLRSAQLPGAEASEHIARILGTAPTLVDPLAALSGGGSEDVGKALTGIACVLNAVGA